MHGSESKYMQKRRLNKIIIKYVNEATNNNERIPIPIITTLRVYSTKNNI